MRKKNLGSHSVGIERQSADMKSEGVGSSGISRKAEGGMQGREWKKMRGREKGRKEGDEKEV